MAGNNRLPWVIVGSAGLVAAGVIGAALIITQDGDQPTRPAAAAPSSPQAAPTSDPASAWPPPLPPGVPDTGEHAWRATWTPDPDAEQQYMADLLDFGDTTFGEGYVQRNADKLLEFGYGVCRDYYSGVPGPEEADHVTAQFVDDPTFQPALTDGGSYGDVRTGSAAMAATSLTMAANRHLCMNIDPWGESY